MSAISVDEVGGIWQRWQKANPHEAADVNRKFTNQMFFGNARIAIAAHIANVARLTGIPKHIVSEYVLRHARD